LKKAIEDWEKKVDGNLKQKIFVYAGHDATGWKLLKCCFLQFFNIFYF
jgi:hypothetical protein